MTIKKRQSLRKCINDNCKTCIYDPNAAGTWRQQVMLCTVTSCDLFPARPVTKSPIPKCVLTYYGTSSPETVFLGPSRPQEERISGRFLHGNSGVARNRLATQGGLNGAVSEHHGETHD